MKTVSFGQNFDEDLEIKDIERQRRLADALRAQSQQPLQGGMAGQVYVGPSWTQGLAKMLQAYGAGRIESGARDQQRALAEALGTRNRQESADFMQAMQPQAARGANEMDNEPVQPGPMDPNRALAIALNSRQPMLQAAGGQLLAQHIKRPELEEARAIRQQELADQRTARMAELQAKIDDAKAMREEKIAAQKELEQLRLDAKREQAQQQQEFLRQQAQQAQQGRLDLARLAASLRPAPQGPQPQMLTNEQGVWQVGRDNVAQQVVGPDGKPLPGKSAVGKALPSPAAKDLTEKAEAADATKRFAETFQDGYGGKTVLGDLDNTGRRIFGDSTNQAQWWQDYAFHRNQIRNKLFGSALTLQEKTEWEKADISPRMDSGQIKKNLERRAEIEDRALNRLIRANTAAGYNKQQIEELTGRTGEGGGPRGLPSASDIEAEMRRRGLR